MVSEKATLWFYPPRTIRPAPMSFVFVWSNWNWIMAPRNISSQTCLKRDSRRLKSRNCTIFVGESRYLSCLRNTAWLWISSTVSSVNISYRRYLQNWSCSTSFPWLFPVTRSLFQIRCIITKSLSPMRSTNAVFSFWNRKPMKIFRCCFCMIWHRSGLTDPSIVICSLNVYARSNTGPDRFAWSILTFFCGLLSPLGFVFLFNLFIFSLLFFRRSAAIYSLFMHSLSIWLNDIETVPCLCIFSLNIS